MPVWFTVRQNSCCSSGAHNLFRSTELLRRLPPNIHAIVRPVLQKNSCWGHPEQMLLSMVSDDCRETRETAVRLIRAARLQETEDVRPFNLPEVNFAAEEYKELIDWSSVVVTQLLRDVSDDALQEIITTPAALAPYPVHTQAVERESSQDGDRGQLLCAGRGVPTRPNHSAAEAPTQPRASIRRKMYDSLTNNTYNMHCAVKPPPPARIWSTPADLMVSGVGAPLAWPVAWGTVTRAES